MLKLMRNKKVTKMVLWGTLILILPAFVIWGAGNMGSKDKGPAFVGTINNKKVSFDAFAESLACMRAQILLNFFDQKELLDAFLKNNEFMGKMAWDRLIMLSETRQKKIHVKNEEVIGFIRTLPIFTRNGKFDDRIYGYVLRNNLGLAPRSFEEMMRENIAIQRLNMDMTKDVRVSDEDVLIRYKAENEKFKVIYALLGPDDAEKKYTEVLDLMAKNGISFEKAAEKASLKLTTTDLFSKAGYVEGLGEASQLTDAAAKLKIGDLSSPVMTRAGTILFKLLETQNFDEEKFKKEKEEYTKKALADNKNKFLADWLRGLEQKSVLKIDLKEYDKYYK
jgi:hypothetical protein